jgi:hypothetical protein
MGVAKSARCNWGYCNKAALSGKTDKRKAGLCTQSLIVDRMYRLELPAQEADSAASLPAKVYKPIPGSSKAINSPSTDNPL